MPENGGAEATTAEHFCKGVEGVMSIVVSCQAGGGGVDQGVGFTEDPSKVEEGVDMESFGKFSLSHKSIVVGGDIGIWTTLSSFFLPAHFALTRGI